LRLKQHAGLPISGEEIPDDTLAGFIFNGQRGQTPSLDTITADIIDCLDRLATYEDEERGNEERGSPVLNNVFLHSVSTTY
jgi:hypothetical protein